MYISKKIENGTNFIFHKTYAIYIFAHPRTKTIGNHKDSLVVLVQSHQYCLGPLSAMDNVLSKMFHNQE